MLHVPVLVSLCAVNAVLSLWQLLLSNDVEKNPGPNSMEKMEEISGSVSVTASGGMQEGVITMEAVSDMLKNIQQQGQQQIQQSADIKSELSSIKSELHQVKEKCDQISQRCDGLERENGRLASAVEGMKTDLTYLFDDSAQGRVETEKLSTAVETLTDQVTSVTDEIDRLEEFSRRDNLRIYGIPQGSDRESYDSCARAVADALNSVQSPKLWCEEDVVRAHRVGQARGDQPKPMIVKFKRWRDKMTVLTEKDYRGRLQTKGVRVANDLTRRQSAIVSQAREEGKVAYFVKGRLTVGPRRPDGRTYAQVTAVAATTTTATTTSTPATPTTADDRQRGGRGTSADRRPDQPRHTSTHGGGSPPSRRVAGNDGHVDQSRRDSVGRSGGVGRGGGSARGAGARGGRNEREGRSGGQQAVLSSYMTHNRQLRSTSVAK